MHARIHVHTDTQQCLATSLFQSVVAKKWRRITSDTQEMCMCVVRVNVWVCGYVGVHASVRVRGCAWVCVHVHKHTNAKHTRPCK